MRILHFLPVYIPAWQYGGPVLSVSRLCEGLVNQDVDVRVITTTAGLSDFPDGQYGIPQIVNGVEVFYYPVDRQDGPILSRSLVDSLPRHIAWAELVHLSSIWQPLGLPVQKAANAANVPVIQTLRGALGPYSWQSKWWKKIPYFLLHERAYLQSAAAIHCTSSQEASEIEWLRLNSKSWLLPNPVDISKLHYHPEVGHQWRKAAGIPVDCPLLLVAGRLHHKKGLDLLPKVLNSLQNLPWHIVFIGKDADGTLLMIQSQFQKYGLSNRCHWIDSVSSDKLLHAYNAADILLLPSRHENFGNVVIEALACGCGVLISDRVGVAESVANCPGVYVCPRSLPEWIRHLELALSRERPGMLSEQFIRNSFTLSSIVSQAKKFYTSLIHA